MLGCFGVNGTFVEQRRKRELLCLQSGVGTKRSGACVLQATATKVARGKPEL